MRNAFFFLAVAAVVGLFANFFMKHRPKARAPLTMAPAPVSPERERRIATLEKAVGLQKARMRHDDSTNFLDVTLHVASSCPAGDADLIRLELEHSDAPDLLVSVEALDSSVKPVVKKTGLGVLKTGATYTFEIPRASRASRLGIFVCKDSSKQGHCVGKAYADLNDMFAEYGKQVSRARNPPDRIYFFQFLNIQDGEYVAAFDRARLTRDNYGRLPEYLRETDAAAGSGSLLNDAKYLMSVTAAAVSLPLRLGRTIQIDLPMHDQAMCKPENLAVPVNVPRAVAGKK